MARRRSQYSSKALTVLPKHVEAVELRAQGLSLTEIAKRLGYKSTESVNRAIVAGLERFRPEGLEDARTIELLRIDRMAARCESIMDETDDVDRVLFAMDRAHKWETLRTKIQGLEAPSKHQFDIHKTSQEHVQIEVVESVNDYLDAINSLASEARKEAAINAQSTPLPPSPDLDESPYATTSPLALPDPESAASQTPLPGEPGADHNPSQVPGSASLASTDPPSTDPNEERHASVHLLHRGVEPREEDPQAQEPGY